jgi:hypothetical protein
LEDNLIIRFKKIIGILKKIKEAYRDNLKGMQVNLENIFVRQSIKLAAKKTW